MKNVKRRIRLTINGENQEIEVENARTLLEVIREDLFLLGTKVICGMGECGACTVLMDGLAVNACLVLAVDANGKNIETIEGIAKGGKLHPVQEAFIEKGAIQCGFCTPGMVLTAKSFLAKNHAPSEQDVKAAVAGNFCRCTGYVRIIDAILSVAYKMKEA